jgi:hypothetical protein
MAAQRCRASNGCATNLRVFELFRGRPVQVAADLLFLDKYACFQLMRQNCFTWRGVSLIYGRSCPAMVNEAKSPLDIVSEWNWEIQLTGWSWRVSSRCMKKCHCLLCKWKEVTSNGPSFKNNKFFFALNRSQRHPFYKFTNIEISTSVFISYCQSLLAPLLAPEFTAQVVCTTLIKNVYRLPVAAVSTVGFVLIFIVSPCIFLTDGQRTRSGSSGPAEVKYDESLPRLSLQLLLKPQK